jgi:hypothetical protein
LTRYVSYGISLICIKEKERLLYSVVLDAVMSGFPIILTKNHECAPILNAIALTGKNPVRASKRGNLFTNSHGSESLCGGWGSRDGKEVKPF